MQYNFREQISNAKNKLNTIYCNSNACGEIDKVKYKSIQLKKNIK